MTTLSVVLPAYNHARELPTALEALARQDRPADEIIVVDDGSTDDTALVADAHAATCPGVRVLSSPGNEGVVAALNRGLRQARGDYLYFAAADDWVMPGFFGRAIERLEAHPGAGLFSGESRLVDGVTGRPIGLRPVVRPRRGAGVVAPDAARRLLRRSDNWVVTGAAVFRADSVGRAGGFDEELGSFADGFLVRKIVLREGFYFEPAVTQTWRIYLDGVSRRRALDPVAAVEGLRLWPARIAADGAFPAWYPERFRRRWRFAAARLALDAEPVNEGVLAAMAVESRLDRAVLLRLCPRIDRRAARLVGLTWLWLRLRPGSLLPLARTALMRRTRPLTRMTR